jgi:diamine N-acetyltransferase
MQATQHDVISVARVGEDTRRPCLELRVLPEQTPFLPDVQSSLDLAAKYPQSIPLAVSHRKHGIVGFALVGVDDASGHWKLFRLLIGAQDQRKGYGKLALRAILAMLRSDHAATDILVTYHEENVAASRLYSQFGFSVYGQDGTKVLARAKGNAVRMAGVFEDLRAEGEPVADEDITHPSPARYGHINPYGKYTFEIDGPLDDALLDLEQKNLPGFA